ncbi:MAG: RnfABCDGE type electron transport complex subunit D [Bacilli bacterium]|nr:RnfABCDGE type electron transport complex subunit D [Bacilli bacterium]
MNNRVYLHSKEKENSLVKLMIYLLIPFFLLGFYKNGIQLYRHHLVSIVMLFKPLFLLGISIFVSLLFSIIKRKPFVSYLLLTNILISLVTMPNTNIIMYLVTIIVINAILCFINFNAIALFMIILFIFSIFLKDYTFLNAFEKSVEHDYSFINYLFGQGSGGIGNSFFLFSIISLLVLCFRFSYKKHIPLTAFSIYYILLIIYSFITGNIDLDLYMNNNLVFGVIFIAPLTMISPYTKGGCYIYGTLLGLLSFITIFIDINIGIYFIIFLLSLFYKLFDKMLYLNNKR